MTFAVFTAVLAGVTLVSIAWVLIVAIGWLIRELWRKKKSGKNLGRALRDIPAGGTIEVKFHGNGDITSPDIALTKKGKEIMRKKVYG